MNYREMAIDAGAGSEDEIRHMAEMIEEDHKYDQWAAEAEAMAQAQPESET